MISGKPLTTLGLMSSAERTKLNGIASGAQVNLIESIKVNNVAQSITNKSVNISVPTYTNATTSTAGLMSSSDKSKLNGIASGAQVNTINTIKINGTTQTISNKTVDLSIPVETVNYYRRNNCNMVIIGDSWSVGGSASDTNHRYSTLLCNRLGMTELNFGVGGAGFTRPNNTFISQVETANANTTAQQKDNTGIVLICGGVNDLRNMSSTTAEDFLQAVVDCMNAAHNYFPDALIVLAIGNTMLDTYTETAQYWITYAQMEAVRSVTYPVLVIKNLGASVNGRAENYISDKLHLTDIGHSKFASHIANAIMGGNQDVFYFVGVITTTEYVGSFSTVPHIWRNNNKVIITSGDINFSSELTSQTTLGSIPSEIAPKKTLGFPCYRGNAIIGNIFITNTGSFIFKPESINTGVARTSCITQQMEWLFTGSY
jgi:lysophospholipase L1-like esterase